MKKFFDSLTPEAKAVFWILFTALILGVAGATAARTSHHNEILTQR